MAQLAPKGRALDEVHANGSWHHALGRLSWRYRKQERVSWVPGPQHRALFVANIVQGKLWYSSAGAKDIHDRKPNFLDTPLLPFSHHSRGVRISRRWGPLASLSWLDGCAGFAAELPLQGSAASVDLAGGVARRPPGKFAVMDGFAGQAAKNSGESGAPLRSAGYATTRFS